MDTSSEESFVTVDVAQPTQQALIQQQAFDHGTPARKEAGKGSKRNLKRLRPQTGKVPTQKFRRNDLQPAEATLIAEAQLRTVGEPESDVGVFQVG